MNLELRIRNKTQESGVYPAPLFPNINPAPLFD
jgi:hypothetical protein